MINIAVKRPYGTPCYRAQIVTDAGVCTWEGTDFDLTDEGYTLAKEEALKEESKSNDIKKK